MRKIRDSILLNTILGCISRCVVLFIIIGLSFLTENLLGWSEGIVFLCISLSTEVAIIVLLVLNYTRSDEDVFLKKLYGKHCYLKIILSFIFGEIMIMFLCWCITKIFSGVSFTTAFQILWFGRISVNSFGTLEKKIIVQKITEQILEEIEGQERLEAIEKLLQQEPFIERV